MPFSEEIKFEAKRKAFFRCVICHMPFVEVHHIIPQANGGGDGLENAAPLCASCHDLYGANPDKQKSIRQLRDDWYERVAAISKDDQLLFDPIHRETSNFNVLKDKGIAIYHCVYATDSFETSAKILVSLVRSAQKEHPNQKRFLYLDIEGHRNTAGGFDHDMFELQTHFCLDFLGKFLTELHLPLAHCRRNNLQNNDVPDEIQIFDANTTS